MHLKVPFKHLNVHETKRHALRKFLLIAGILVFYSAYLILKFGSNGIALGIITWAAFVMATPLPDGGIVIDFPLRLVTGIRMVVAEILVWAIAIGANIYFLLEEPQIYQKTLISRSFHQVLVTPWPDWIIIIISAMGTFLGLYFGDELLDVALFKERRKYIKLRWWYRSIFMLFALVAFYFLYREFLALFGIRI